MKIKINVTGHLYIWRPRCYKGTNETPSAYDVSRYSLSSCMGGDDVCRDACPFFGEPVYNKPGTDDKSGVLSLCIKDLDFNELIDERIINKEPKLDIQII